MITKVTTYQGKPVISLMKDENDRFPFTFGVGKAKKIIDAIEDIKRFVQENQTADDLK